MNMKSYSFKEEGNFAYARIEGVDGSFKDLAEVCGRIQGMTTDRALILLEKFKSMELPVLYKRRNKYLGSRRELGGKKGRYPQKAAGIVLKAMKSAISNAKIKGMDEPYLIVHMCANRKHNYPRLAAKGRRNRQDYETARVEVVLKEKTVK